MNRIHRIGQLELVQSESISKNSKKYLEIVKWTSETLCFTIASWSTDKDGDFPGLNYCMDRPLKEDIDKEAFDELVKLGYNIYNFRELSGEDLL